MWVEEKITLNEHEFAILSSDSGTKLVHKIDVYQAEVSRFNSYHLKSTYQNIHGISRENAIKRIM
jgi:hypothetical protein